MERLVNSKIPKIAFLTAAIVSFACVLILLSARIIDQHETKRLDAESVTLATNRTISYNTNVRVSDFIDFLQGTLLDDYIISTDILGDQDVSFRYINTQGKIRSVNFNINIVDDIKPIIYGSDFYALEVGSDNDLTNLMLSGDDLDDTPHREIIGEYDLNKPGIYNLSYKITDFSSNEAIKNFTLNVLPKNQMRAPSTTSKKDYINDAIKQYKTPATKIGIDVSSWQGDINWQETKANGVEFAFIRIGYQTGYNGEYVVDRYFERNIEGATEAGLPVGVYFYSYANSLEQARQQANWIAEQVASYPLELGIVFDWENWSEFNIANMSFRTLNNVASEFIREVNKLGYAGLIYGSKNYLERFWQLDGQKTWLAQYYDRPTYAGEFDFWQMSCSGVVPGITGDVDIDVMYLK